MTLEDELDAVLMSIWGHHVNFLGEDIVRKIKHGVINQAPMEELVALDGAEAFDWQTTLQIVTNAATLVVAVLTAYDMLEKRFGRAPVRTELKSELEDQSTLEQVSSRSVSAKIEEVVDEVIEQKKHVDE